MLKISQANSNARAATLQLEGQVVGPWVSELQRVCEGILAGHRNLALDFTRVSFLDAKGITLVLDLIQRQVSVQNCSPFIAEQLKGSPALNLESGRHHA